MDKLDYLNYFKNSLPSEDQQKLFEMMGIHRYRDAVKECGGKQVYISKPESISRIDRDWEIYCDFAEKGKSVKELSVKHRISTSEIRRIISSVEKRCNK